ncbi:MAG TPA: hypothetical protein VI078_09265 [bacterium]
MATMVEAVGLGRHSGSVAAAEAAAHGSESVAKNVLLFFAAPFIGLAYIIAFPFIGVAVMVRTALR